MKYFLIVILLSLSTVLYAQRTSNSYEEAFNDYKTGLQYDANGEYSKALSYFSKAYREGDNYFSPLKLAQYLILLKGDRFDEKDRNKYIKEGIAFAKIAAEYENSDAMNLLGLYYTQFGKSTTDFKESIRWFNKSAYEYSNPIAQLFLAITFEENTDNRAKLVQSAANSGLEEAKTLMAGNNSDEIINNIGNSLIDKILNTSSNLNNSVNAVNTQKSQVTSSSNTNINNKSGFDILLQQANNGDVQAMYSIGEAYLYGEGVMTDKKKAFEWILKAADNGHSHAQATVSLMFAMGEGIDSSDKNAFKYALKSAESNYPYGLCVLADFYNQGIGTKKNPQEALNCLLKAAQMEYVPAYRALGVAYLIGDSAMVDSEESFKWTKMAAQEGDASAQSMLSMLYTCGIGTNKNYYEAEKWGKKAIEQEEIAGYASLAKLYSNGISKDTKKALEYIDKGISKFNEAQKDISDDYIDWDILDFYCVKGEVYLADHQLEKAREIASEIVKINPDYSNVFDSGLMDFYYGRTNKDTQLANAQKPEIQSDVDVNIPANNWGNQNTFAIIIGNEHYEDVSDVEFANRDADSFAKYCEMVLGVPSTNIRKYKDASYGKMIGALEDIRSIAKAYNGDLNIIFYYAGHGIPSEKDFSSYLLPVDGSGRSTSLCLSLNDLYETLAETDANRILVFLDACFSGATRGDGMLTAARGVAIKAQPEEPRKNMVIFSASSDDETAYPLKEQGHGLFTYYLLKKLQESKGNLTLAELSKYINENVRKQSVVINRKSQTPTTSGTVDLNVNWFTK